MLLQTNSYIVPRDKREEHARLVRKFRQVLLRLGCESFEVYEQVGTNWAPGEATGRYVQMMRFHDRKHQEAVQAAEKADKGAQHVIREFCELINFPYQQQHGLFASGFYQSVLPSGASRPAPAERPARPAPARPAPPPVVPGASAASGAAAAGSSPAPAVPPVKPGASPDDCLDSLHQPTAPAASQPADTTPETDDSAGFDDLGQTDDTAADETGAVGEIEDDAAAGRLDLEPLAIDEDESTEASAFDLIQDEPEEGEVVDEAETFDTFDEEDRSPNSR